MLTLSYPAPTNANYPRNNFLSIGNLLRVTEFNYADFRKNTDTNVFVLEDEHILIQLLHHLAIDPGWTLEEVVGQCRYRANALASLFKITCANKLGTALYNGFYCEGTLEHWTLIDNVQQYTSSTLVDNIHPLVPLYSTVTNRGYKHNALRDRTNTSRPANFAIMGIDIVALGVGYWKWMQVPDNLQYGSKAQYCCQYPLVQAQFYHNQLSLVNILYEFFSEDADLKSMVTHDTVSFTTMSEDKLIVEYLGHIVNDLTDRRLAKMEAAMAKIGSIYQKPHFNYLRGGRQRLFTQARWSWEIGPLKMIAIYLSVANRMKYRATDLNTMINRAIKPMISNYSRIPEQFCRELVVALANEVSLLNLQNMKN